MSLREALTARQRLLILTHLASARHLRLDETMLLGILRDKGVAASPSQLKGQLAWLEEQGLLTLSDGGATGDIVAMLTGEGESIANGDADYPGIERPNARMLAQRALRSAIGLKPEE